MDEETIQAVARTWLGLQGAKTVDMEAWRDTVAVIREVLDAVEAAGFSLTKNPC